jgi:hypothetical protein
MMWGNRRATASMSDDTHDGDMLIGVRLFHALSFCAEYCSISREIERESRCQSWYIAANQRNDRSTSGLARLYVVASPRRSMIRDGKKNKAKDPTEHRGNIFLESPRSIRSEEKKRMVWKTFDSERKARLSLDSAPLLVLFSSTTYPGDYVNYYLIHQECLSLALP